jgi:hypothetical protein
MPIYTYEVIRPDGTTGDCFEVEQRMSEEPLSTHPLSGDPVRKVYHAPNLTTRYTAGGEKRLQDDHYLAQKGFAKYVRDGSGGYVRTNAGEGPQRLDAEAVRAAQCSGGACIPG